MDNQTFDVTSDGDGIGNVLSVIWGAAAFGGEARHFKVAMLSEQTRYYANPATPILTENCNNMPGMRVHHITSMVEDANGTPTMILLWGKERDSTALPYHFGLDESAWLIRGWLKTVEYGPMPDHDGECTKGWRLFTDDCGHVAGYKCAIVGVQPAWAIYGV